MLDGAHLTNKALQHKQDECAYEPPHSKLNDSAQALDTKAHPSETLGSRGAERLRGARQLAEGVCGELRVQNLRQNTLLWLQLGIEEPSTPFSSCESWDDEFHKQGKRAIQDPTAPRS